jgi:predicted Zn finger-like uncharacterized protein
MSSQQATRCPNCATVFRVATAQLQAYEGWVRCGRCAEVFNAESCLVELDAPPASVAPAPSAAAASPVTAVDFDLDFDVPATPMTLPAAPSAAASMVRAASGLAPAYRDDSEHRDEDNMVERAVKAMRPGPAPAAASESPAWPQPAPAQPPVAPDFGPAFESPQAHDTRPLPPAVAAPTSVHPPPPPPSPPPLPAAEVRIEPLLDAPAPQPLTHDRGADLTPAVAAEVPAPDDFAADPRWLPYADPAGVPMTADAAAMPLATHPEAQASAPGDWRDQPVPSFVQKANRAERWRNPRVRWALAAVCLLSLLGVLLQAAHEYRDLVAARFEITRPLLERGCSLLACSVSAPRALDAEGVSVESSGLVRIEKTNTYKLNIALRNRASMAVAVPALELSLTDAQGKLMARRVLRTTDFGVTPSSVAAGRELSLQATLQTAFATANNEPQEAVAGYTIELFYP